MSTSLMLVTALNPKIGYDNASKVDDERCSPHMLVPNRCPDNWIHRQRLVTGLFLLTLLLLFSAHQVHVSLALQHRRVEYHSTGEDK